MKHSKLIMLSVALAAAAVFARVPPPFETEGKEKTTTSSGLTIIQVQPSEGGAANGDVIRVHYTGRLKDSDKPPFDSSVQRDQPLEFVLGTGKVIKGWEEGLAGMKVGEKRQLIVPPDLAYGEKGRGDVIPPNSTLVFDVEMVGIRRK